MAAETDGRCRGDVKKLALMFEELAASSRDTTNVSDIVNRKGCRGTSDSGTTYTGYSPQMYPMDWLSTGHTTTHTGYRSVRYSVGGLNESTYCPLPVPTYVDKRPSVTCDECGKLHPPYSYCRYAPCMICGKDDHPFEPRCPYFYRLPKGAAFPSEYEIVCRCGDIFNVEKWACCSCPSGGVPVLNQKYCGICHTWSQHCEYECTEDLDLAAAYKAYRDKCLANVPIPDRSEASTSTFVGGDM